MLVHEEGYKGHAGNCVIMRKTPVDTGLLIHLSQRAPAVPMDVSLESCANQLRLIAGPNLVTYY